jgi:hypothetical protein
MIHICFLLSTRYEEHYGMVLKLIASFILKVGIALDEKQVSDLLLVVTELKIGKGQYFAWNDCIGSFLQIMGAELFFKVLPMRLTDLDMNSLRFA